MSTEFLAGYVSGVVGILIGNPLDIIKMRYQTQSTFHSRDGLGNTSNILKGTAAPVIGYGAINALLFASYHQSEAVLKSRLSTRDSLAVPWLAGFTAGLAIWIVSTPTELIKCRAQLAAPSVSSLVITQQTLRTNGIRGLYRGGLVTALRDSIGYGFYFWSYKWAMQALPAGFFGSAGERGTMLQQDAPRILVCGGFAGIATWASIFPLDVIKSRLQGHLPIPQQTGCGVTSSSRVRAESRRSNAWQITKDLYSQDGLRPFFRGLTVCSARAFIVNAAQWMVYEGMMRELQGGRGLRTVSREMTLPE